MFDLFQLEGPAKARRIVVAMSGGVDSSVVAALAAQTGAQVVLIWGERLAWGRGYRLHTSTLGHELSPDLDVAVVQINQAMERLVLQRPGQYLWGYARYKGPRSA